MSHILWNGTLIRNVIFLFQRTNFPAVTICNLNMLKIGKVHRSRVIDEFLKHHSKEANTSSQPQPNRMEPQSTSPPRETENSSRIDDKISRWGESLKKSLESRAKSRRERDFMKDVRVDSSRLKHKYFDRVIKSLPEGQLVEMGHDFHEMVKSCRWSEYRCDAG